MEIHRHVEQELEGASAEYDRLRSVFDVIKGDERARSLLSDLVHSCGEYTDVVTRFNVFTSQGPQDGQAYRSAREQLDQLRRTRHEALISNLRIFQRYVREHYGENGDIEPHSKEDLPQSVLYTGATSERMDIGQWAIRLTAALLKVSDADFAALLRGGEADS